MSDAADWAERKDAQMFIAKCENRPAFLAELYSLLYARERNRLALEDLWRTHG